MTNHTYILLRPDGLVTPECGGEKQLLLWLICTQRGMKGLFSIFLFMTKLLQRGWDTCFSFPLDTERSTLILVLCAEDPNDHRLV